MGERGEVFSTKLVRNDRTYFFNVKENIYGDLFLNIVESRPTDTEGRYLRQSVIVPEIHRLHQDAWNTQAKREPYKKKVSQGESGRFRRVMESRLSGL